MRLRGEGRDERGEEQRRHEAEAAHRQSEEDRRRQDEDHAAPGDRADRLALDAQGLDQDDDAEQHEHARQHEREVARPHAERGADVERRATETAKNSAERR